MSTHNLLIAKKRAQKRKRILPRTITPLYLTPGKLLELTNGMFGWKDCLTFLTGIAPGHIATSTKTK